LETVKDDSFALKAEHLLPRRHGLIQSLP